MKALYRKYRPLKLADIVGQPQVVDILKNAIKTGKFSHAYLFTGPRGCGKTSVARIFAHEVNKFDYKLEDSYIDILEIDGASNRGIDNIRELREKAAIAPSEGKYKVYIIDEVHMLTKEAFNALLKTLEEPPAHVIFLMATTDLNRVPVTILSRSQVLHFKLTDPETMVKHLAKIAEAEAIQIEDDALRLLARRGGGSFRDTISLLDQISIMFDGKKTKISAEQVVSALGLPRDNVLENILKSYDNRDFTTLASNLQNELDGGTSAILIASELINYLLKHPNPARLPLLQTLTSVDGAYPEAKLLLAFSGAFANAPMSAPVAPKVQSAVPPQFVSKASENASETPKTPESTPEAAPEPPQTAFSTEVFLSSVSSSNASIGEILKKSHISVNGRIVRIAPEKRIYCNILKSANNAELIRKNLPEGYGFELGEFNANSEPKDATISQISDIMGNVQELKTGQSDPF